MADPRQEWTERELCEAFDLSSQELQRLVMEGVISPPTRKFTRQFRYNPQHVDQLRRYLHSRDRQRYLQDLLKRWERELDVKTTVQLEVDQLLSVERLFGSNSQQGLDELSQFEKLAPGIVIVLSVLTSEHVLGQLKRQKVASVLRKPILPSELLQAVNQALDAGGARPAEDISRIT